MHRIVCAAVCLVGIATLGAQVAAPSPGRNGKIETAAQAFTPFEGRYRLPEGSVVELFRMGVVQALATPTYVNWATGRMETLVSAGSDRFVSAASPSNTPPTLELCFTRDHKGEVASIAIREQGAPEVKATRMKRDPDRQISFVNGPVTLAGSLRLPEGKGPFPAVVLVHGSGPGERTQLAAMQAWFARIGMAALAYDKRGCGESTGDWKQVDLEALAGDALAGAAKLRGLKEVDPKRVGLWGISQGGWITPLAASLDSSIAFAINSSGPATSLRRQDTFMMGNMLRSAGFLEDEVSQALAGLQALYDHARGRTSAEAYDAVMEKTRSHPKLKDLAHPPAKDLDPVKLYAQQAIGDPAWFYHLDPDRNGLEPYKNLKCPMLVTYGRLDWTVPVDESVQLLESLKLPAHRLTLRVIPDAGHGALRMDTQHPRKPAQPMMLCRDLFDSIESWLRERGVLAKR